jgi:hypothetical protein
VDKIQKSEPASGMVKWLKKLNALNGERRGPGNRHGLSASNPAESSRIKVDQGRSRRKKFSALDVHLIAVPEAKIRKLR